MRKIHNRRMIAGLLFGVAILTGCGGGAKVPDTVESSSLIIEKDGQITAHVVDTFDKDYYDLDGLKDMAEEDLKNFNDAQSSDAAVTLERVEMVPESSDVVVTYRFPGTDAYGKFTGSNLYFGTIGEAADAGYDFDGINQMLFSVTGDKSMVSSDLLKSGMDKKHVILLEEGTRVYCPYKVALISENADVMEDGSIDTSGIFREEYPVIIVLDK